MRQQPPEGASVRVLKLRPDGALAFAWDGRVLQADDEGIVLHAEFNVDQVDLGFTTFWRGDVFVEFYYWERWYNVFQVSAPDGTLKGWYANLGQPAELEIDIDSAVLRYVDLALDVWTAPDGAFQVLDEDELQAVLEQRPDLAAGVRSGRDELLAVVTSGRLPRWPPA